MRTPEGKLLPNSYRQMESLFRKSQKCDFILIVDIYNYQPMIEYRGDSISVLTVSTKHRQYMQLIVKFLTNRIFNVRNCTTNKSGKDIELLFANISRRITMLSCPNFDFMDFIKQDKIASIYLDKTPQYEDYGNCAIELSGVKTIKPLRKCKCLSISLYYYNTTSDLENIMNELEELDIPTKIKIIDAPALEKHYYDIRDSYSDSITCKFYNDLI